MRYLASSPCMAAATAAWGGWGYLRKPAELFPGTVAKVSPHPKAMTVQRPARRGGGAAVTTVRPPAPPTAPRPQNTGGTQTRPARPPPAPPQGACAHFATPSAQAQCEVLAPGINRTHPAAECEVFLPQIHARVVKDWLLDHRPLEDENWKSHPSQPNCNIRS